MIVQRRFSLMPTVVKNLLIINGLFFLGMYSIRNTFGIDITDWLGLYFPLSDSFLPVQLVSHMFMHGNMGHIFSNMIMLWFFGQRDGELLGPEAIPDLLPLNWIRRQRPADWSQRVGIFPIKCSTRQRRHGHDSEQGRGHH